MLLAVKEERKSRADEMVGLAMDATVKEVKVKAAEAKETFDRVEESFAASRALTKVTVASVDRMLAKYVPGAPTERIKLDNVSKP